ncbi:pyruvate dehydrogenase (acetyl-transferring), homodimeric type [Nitrosococcus wardiae]|uniref:Pyruvate dehydrogenase E1 component n=1 Tax=Nitrosococcus wardiae TaxID=1814290 RepID=A0A4P7C217_9GAMM|nr:pyruvate dehydrogenase (acetyl-transferring), homodimeric type [Nitrosococcus wardiae]QBQ56553.1 pyruvate dehydrogenase (acetyl-transferring), homodimeric type [Nitrosococcus wardiae]
MAKNKAETIENIEAQETREWLESLDYVLQQGGPQRTVRLLDRLRLHAQKAGVSLPYPANTPYINTIPADQQSPFPGSQEIERRIRSLVRWNAMAMVVRANREEEGIGGHISTFASAATLYEVGLNHFFRAKSKNQEGDLIYFQGHASTGTYARAFLEGRLSEHQLENFRRELKPEGGLASYPHPWLMPHFWEFPTVSMGLSPIMAIYQARFNRYLEDRGLKQPSKQKVWAFIGDGETDEPETLGAISLAAREKLDNLIFVVNCNLQRLDGPVRGNGKIIQELEAIFRGAGWNVIKVIWGSDWDPLLAKDYEGVLVRRMEQAVDGDYQKYAVESGSYIREHFFGTDPRLQEMVKHLSDEQLRRLRTGGHDPEKVYGAYKTAVEHQGSPTVILARTIKGYGLGEAGEGKNITHQQKKLNEQELGDFRTRFGIPISDDRVAHAPFYKPPEDSPEMKYLHERRQELGGYLPARQVHCEPLQAPSEEFFAEFYQGTGERTMATTMAYVRMLAKLLRDPEIGKLIVPIIPDEARTFGMESLFRQVGIYSHVGQLYEPVDISTLLYYKEATDGQILEEGITEAGSMSSFIAAGTAYATHGINTIPFFTFYSMFGFQRIGDLIWAAGDMRCHGFLVGATSGRTTLAGEGLQHQDGHSHALAYSVPNLKAYDPAYAHEIAVIIQDGIYRMYEQQEDIFYYLTVTNEFYPMPEMPAGSREGILKGMYRLKSSSHPDAELRAQLFGSGAILNEVLKAQKLLEDYQVAADVWSITSYKELYLEGHAAERWNMLHPMEKPRVPYVRQCLEEAPGVFVAASDYLKMLPDSIYRWFPRPVISLGTDGFGRSDGRRALRDFFEVDARFITLATLAALAREGKIEPTRVHQAMKDLDIDPEKANPVTS